MPAADVISLKVPYNPSVSLRGSLKMIRYDPPGIRVLGKRWEFALAITDAVGQFLDLTGYTVTVAIGASPSIRLDSVVATIANQTDQPGVATAVFLPDDTAALAIPFGGQFYYQVDVSLDGQNVDTVACGNFRAQKSLI